MEPKELGELLKIVVNLYARQMAMLDLLRQANVSQKQIDEALAKAHSHMAKVPKMAYLSTPRPSDLQGLAELLESIRLPAK